ncbi:hypothetical protein HHL08_07010 [Sphingobium sp. AR-3-1]|uniref:Uncharacterized protein n=1 Tax=Sphingobium psychrophilum TaxID=2728834 RepID=A0A7X9WU17_9SPHN|nr:hypothetical protein [Sphingobium psychrophilum]NML09900.1 hypothetical protein [Sphingobium psychrophilum]
MKRLLFAIPFLIVASPNAATAASFYIGVTAPDPVGKVLAYEMRERIASSARNKLVLDPDESAFKLMIVTLDPDDEGSQTIYSIVLNFRNYADGENWDYFITSWVGVCGKTVVQSCARTLAGNVDD